MGATARARTVQALAAALLVALAVLPPAVTPYEADDGYDDVFDDVDFESESGDDDQHLLYDPSRTATTEGIRPDDGAEFFPDWAGGGHGSEAGDGALARGTDEDRQTASLVQGWYHEFAPVIMEKLKQYKNEVKQSSAGTNMRDLTRFIPSDLEVFLYDSSASHRVAREEFHGKTKFQKVRIYNSGNIFGRVLLLDGVIQSTQGDEFLYHEGLVQVAMSFHPHPAHVFIGGGGEGCTAREVLRWPQATRVTMVDLDTELVGICKQYLSTYSRGAFEDPRLNLVHDDATKWFATTDEKYDVMILDFPDPNQFTFQLYTKRFYESVRARLNPGGIVVTQSGLCEEAGMEFVPIHVTLKAVFPKVYGYGTPAPLYTGMYCYNLAALDPDFELPSEAVLLERLRDIDLVFYDHVAPFKMLNMPKSIHRQIENADQIITEENPVFYGD